MRRCAAIGRAATDCCIINCSTQLEAAQGCIDEEARQGLELLRAKTKELEVAQVCCWHQLMAPERHVIITRNTGAPCQP